MIKLLYKTREATPPKGKPNVYFCAHPDTFDYWFSSLAEEILESQNCAIWYPDDKNAPRDTDYLDNLKQMQLFIMPVTSDLLYTKNDAIDIEFPFAAKNHIPVLPIMLEKGLAEAFNAKCGELQYLDRTASFQDNEKYPKKLKNFLFNVLIGDKLSEQIRDAFDAYVFLSYRKKDKKYAEELMRLIHKNDFCRDIAIWYDEFLTPGENFNDSIQEAISKSDLFVLAVTPNLIDELNYIITNEYPAAKAAGKPILPAEVVPTDRSMLEEKYNGIPPCTNAYDEAAFSSALTDFFKDIALNEQNNTPQHIFFIGLAYLGGIDVEIDYKKALALITKAAEGGLAEAMKKLSYMYRLGNGTKQSYEEAVNWMECFVDTLNESFCAEQEPEKLEIWLEAALELGELYTELGRTKDAAELYKKADKEAFHIFVVHNEQELYDHFIPLRIRIKEKLGDIYMLTDEPYRASFCYGDASGLVSEKYKYPPTEEFYRMKAYYSIKDAEATRQNSINEYTETVYEQVRSYALCLSEEDIFRQTVLAKVSQGLAGVAYYKQDYEKAKNLYNEALDLLLTILLKTNSLSLRQELISVYKELLPLYEKEKNWERFKLCYEQIELLSGEIAEKSGTITTKANHAESLIDLGKILWEEEDYKNCKKALTTALEIRKEINKKIGTVNTNLEICSTLFYLGEMYRNMGDTAAAKKYYENALTIREEIWFDISSKDGSVVFMYIFLRLCEIYLLKGDLSKARDYYEKAKKELFFAKKECKDININEITAMFDLLYGHILKAEGHIENAISYYKSALNYFSNYCNYFGYYYKLKEKAAETLYALYTSSDDYSTKSIKYTKTIYSELAEDFPQIPRFKRLKDKLEQKIHD